MTIVARILSYILHPIFVPVYLYLLFTEIEPVMSLVFSGKNFWAFGISLMITVVLVPLICLMYFKHKGMLDSFSMPTLKGRSLSYVTVAAIYLVSLYMLKEMDLPMIIYAMFIGIAIMLILMAVISMHYKISAHMAAIGGVIGAVVWLGYYFGLWYPGLLMFLVLLSGFLATSRLYLQVHSESEVATGFILGGLSIFAALLIMVP